MANFGFSISDIYLVSNYAYSVYKSCKNAGDNFREIAAEVDALRSLLLALDNEYKRPRSSFRHLTPMQEAYLAVHLQDYKADLRSVKRILHRFRSLDTRDPHYHDKLAVTNEQQADIREKITVNKFSMQLFLSGQEVAPMSAIEKDTEASSLSLSALNVQSNETRKDTSTGRRNASKYVLPENGLPSDDRLSNGNTTEAEVDTLFEAKGWLHPSNEDIPRPAKKVYRSFRHFYNDTDASIASFGYYTPVESVVEVMHDATVALVTCDGKQLPTAPDMLTLSSSKPSYYSKVYYFQKDQKRWMRAGDTLGKFPEYTSYILEFTLEEVFSGTVRQVDVQRTKIHPKQRYAASVESILLNVQADRGLRHNETIHYLEAGNQSAGPTESLCFILKHKKHDTFRTNRSNLAHEICVSFLEASEGWKREIRHPSGATIEIHANGPTDIGHFLAMEDLGLPYRLYPGYCGNLLLWIRVIDIDDISTRRLNHLKSRGGAYFARVRGEDVIYESTDDPPFPLFTFGDQATRHGKLLTAWFERTVSSHSAH